MAIRNSFRIFMTILKNMKTLHNIQRQLNTTILAITIWSDSLCGSLMSVFQYNNEPKQGGSWSGYNMS